MSMVLTFRVRKGATLAVFLFLATACSREQQDWRSAEAADSVESYARFLERHPESELATEARTRVAQLEEDHEWQRAGAADTADAYRQFLAEHPNGKWAQEARIRIQNFALNGLPPAGPPMAAAPEPPPVTTSPAIPPREAAPSPAELAQAAADSVGPTHVAPTSGPAAPEYSTPYVSAPNVPATNTMPAGSPIAATGYGVQLGAFGSENAANSQWQQLAVRFSSELHGLSPRIVTVNTPTGPLFRLQAQVADEPQARSVCELLRQQSQPCVPVLPR
jgi:cell division protein FtsN